jgi:phosphotriesterase-related protein
VLAHDASCYIDYFPGAEAQAAKEQIAPNWNYTHISKDVLPMLRERGMTDEQIRQMLVDTPRRYFE